MDISVRNFRGCHRADISVAPMALLVGDGGGGKTSICQAAAAALTGTGLPIPGFTKSKAKSLLHRGADKGSVTIDGANGTASVEWPKAEYSTKGDFPKSSPVAVGMTSYLDIADKDRADFLGQYVKNSVPTKKDVSDHLKDEKIDDNVIDIVWKKIEQDGWDPAHAHAKKKGIEIKTLWRSVTGEEWGSRKAEAWLPESWNDDLHNTTEEELKHSVAMAQQNLEVLIGSSAVSFEETKKLTEIAASAVDLEPLEKALTKAISSRNDARFRLAGLPSLSTTSDLAMHCPHCKKESQLQITKLDAGSTKYELVMPTKNPSKEEENKRQQDRAKLEQEVKSADLEESNASLAHGKATAKNRAAKEAQNALDQATTNTTAQSQVDAARESLNLAETRLTAHTANGTALNHHKRILTNQILMDALAVTGIRKACIKRALNEFNEQLTSMCQELNWAMVRIEDDLTVSYDGRALKGLLCSSEYYRCHFLLQILMGIIDGSDILVLDNLDRTTSEAREQILGLLVAKNIPAIVGVMMKDPNKAPNLAEMGLGMTYIVENATVLPVQKQLKIA